MKVLLSIKPEFAEKIFNGTKRFEFRKAIFKNRKVKTVVVYASYPVQKVIGEFSIEDIISNHPNELWETTKEYSGISRDYFGQYFANRNIGHAIRVCEAKIYHTPLSLKDDFNINFPPQSFMYLED